MTDTGAQRLHAIAGETSDRYRWVVLAVTSVGALLAALTSGTLVIALPDILRDLHTDLLGAAVSASRGPHEGFADDVAVARQVAA